MIGTPCKPIGPSPISWSISEGLGTRLDGDRLVIDKLAKKWTQNDARIDASFSFVPNSYASKPRPRKSKEEGWDRRELSCPGWSQAHLLIAHGGVLLFAVGTVLNFFMPVESILSHYWDLASTDEGVRLKAASELMAALDLAQREYEKHQRKVGGAENPCCSELAYSFKRLVKGLASSRKGARQGFTTVLTEVLFQFDCLPPETVISTLSETLEISSNAKSQEIRDSYIGHVFGLMALIRANTTFNGSALTLEGAPWLTQVITTLKSISTKKSFMQELCSKTITDIFTLVKPDDFEEYLLPALKDSLEFGWSGASTDTLFIMLVAQKRFQEKLNTKAIKKAWGKSFIASKDNYKHLASILQDSISVHPRVHCVWEELLQTILHHPEGDLEQFWSTVIDEGLFQSTHDRKFLGFQLVKMVLPQIQSGYVKVVFSSHMMRCLMNNLSSSQSYLHDAAKHLVGKIGHLRH